MMTTMIDLQKSINLAVTLGITSVYLKAFTLTYDGSTPYWKPRHDCLIVDYPDDEAMVCALLLEAYLGLDPDFDPALPEGWMPPTPYTSHLWEGAWPLYDAAKKFSNTPSFCFLCRFWL